MPDSPLFQTLLKKAESIGPNEEAKNNDRWKLGVMPFTPAINGELLKRAAMSPRLPEWLNKPVDQLPTLRTTSKKAEKK
jgi:hypothetical protein